MALDASTATLSYGLFAYAVSVYAVARYRSYWQAVGTKRERDVGRQEMIYRAVCDQCDVAIPSDETHMLIDIYESVGAPFKCMAWCKNCARDITQIRARFFTALLNGDICEMRFRWRKRI